MTVPEFEKALIDNKIPYMKDYDFSTTDIYPFPLINFQSTAQYQKNSIWNVTVSLDATTTDGIRVYHSKLVNGTIRIFHPDDKSWGCSLKRAFSLIQETERQKTIIEMFKALNEK